MLCVFEISKSIKKSNWYSALMVLIDSKSVGISTWHTSSWGSFHMYKQNKCMVTFTVMTFSILKTDKLQTAKFSKLLKEKIIEKAI